MKKVLWLLLAAVLALGVAACGDDLDEEGNSGSNTSESESGGDTVFIHMEIFEGNDPEKGFRPQVVRFGLPSEPWTFAIDRDGTIAARLEGAFSADELRAAVAVAR